MLASEEAEILALKALAFVAADERLLRRFLKLSGVTPHHLRNGAKTKAIQSAMLDFLAANETDLNACAAALSVTPERLAAATKELGACGR